MRKNKDTMTKIQGHDEDYVDVSISRIIACRILNTSTFFFMFYFVFLSFVFCYRMKEEKSKKEKCSVSF